MPIKPENAKRYPADWKKIRARILERAGNKCERCGASNYAVGWRDENGIFYEASGGMLKIVLTIMHLDHTPENCADENLQAACQRCHLHYDHAHHQRNAHDTRRNRKAAGDLFDARP